MSECSRCNGLWVPGKSFDGLVKRAIEAQRASPSAGLGMAEERRRKTAFNRKVEYRKCPVCRGTMQRKNFARRSGIIVDWCGKHGTWLDADELEDLASYILAGGLESADPAAAGGGKPTWSQPADEKRLEALAAAERLMAKERIAQERRRRALTGESDGIVSWRTVGNILSALLDP